MRVQDGGWIDRLKPGARVRSHLSAVGRGCADLLFPPVAFDAQEPTAGPGLSADAFSRVTFLEAPVCDGCGAAFEFDGGDLAQDRCAACLTHPYGFARARAACVYDDASRDLILKFKHGDHQEFAPLFARWIGRAAADLIAGADAIVPVPLHRLRLISRRFNQAAEMARPLARAVGRDYLADALVRVQPTDSQGGKSARGRRLNVKSAFAVSASGQRKVRGRRILLIDDVLTTGATAEACARVLVEAGARAVDLAVIARVRTARQTPT